MRGFELAKHPRSTLLGRHDPCERVAIFPLGNPCQLLGLAYLLWITCVVHLALQT